MKTISRLNSPKTNTYSFTVGERGVVLRDVLETAKYKLEAQEGFGKRHSSSLLDTNFKERFNREGPLRAGVGNPRLLNRMWLPTLAAL